MVVVKVPDIIDTSVCYSNPLFQRTHSKWRTRCTGLTLSRGRWSSGLQDVQVQHDLQEDGHHAFHDVYVHHDLEEVWHHAL